MFPFRLERVVFEVDRVVLHYKMDQWEQGTSTVELPYSVFLLAALDVLTGGPLLRKIVEDESFRRTLESC